MEPHEPRGGGQRTKRQTRVRPAAVRPRIRVTKYSLDSITETEAAGRSDWQISPDPRVVTWVDVVGLGEEQVEPLGNDYGLHPLVLEDVTTPDERPKVEEHDRYLYVILKALRVERSGRAHRVSAEQVAVVLGDRFVLSFREHGEDEIFAPIGVRLRTGGRIRRLGAGYLAYALLDTIVDDYFVVNEQLGDEIERIEDRMVGTSQPEHLTELHRLRRQLIAFRKAVWPLREVVGSLGRDTTQLFGEQAEPFLRDLYDHVVEVMDGIETQRDVITGLLDVYLSSVSNRLNEVMKVLTIISTIFIPLTFIAGVYGMNFDYMPELHQWWAYPAVLALMLVIALAMVVYFRRRRWL